MREPVQPGGEDGSGSPTRTEGHAPHATPGFEVEFRFMAIPDGWRSPVEGSFKAETMISLARLGQQMGADPRNWRSTVPGEMERMKADTEWVVEPPGYGR